MIRPSAPFLHELKVACRRQVLASDGVTSAQHITRVSKSQLDRYIDPTAPDYMPVDVLIDLQRDSGALFVTTLLAETSGCTLVSLSETDRSITDIFADMAKWFGETFLLAASGEALKDSDIIRLGHLIQEHRRQLDALQSAVSSRKGGGAYEGDRKPKTRPGGAEDGVY